MSKYGVFSGPYFSAFGPGKTLYLDTFHTVWTRSEPLIHVQFFWDRLSKKKLPEGEMSHFRLPWADDKNLGKSFIWSRAWVKYQNFRLANAFFSNLNTINLTIFPNHGGIHVWEWTQQIFWKEVKPYGVYGNMRRCIWKTRGNPHYDRLPFCWSWGEGGNILQKRRDKRNGRSSLWNRGFQHLHLYCTPASFLLFFGDKKRTAFKMAKHTQTIRRQQPTNCLSVLDHSVPLGLLFLLLIIVFFWFTYYGSELTKRYASRMLLMCLEAGG